MVKYRASEINFGCKVTPPPLGEWTQFIQPSDTNFPPQCLYNSHAILLLCFFCFICRFNMYKVARCSYRFFKGIFKQKDINEISKGYLWKTTVYQNSGCDRFFHPFNSNMKSIPNAFYEYFSQSNTLIEI